MTETIKEPRAKMTGWRAAEIATAYDSAKYVAAVDEVTGEAAATIMRTLRRESLSRHDADVMQFLRMAVRETIDGADARRNLALYRAKQEFTPFVATIAVLGLRANPDTLQDREDLAMIECVHNEMYALLRREPRLDYGSVLCATLPSRFAYDDYIARVQRVLPWDNVITKEHLPFAVVGALDDVLSSIDGAASTLTRRTASIDRQNRDALGTKLYNA